MPDIITPADVERRLNELSAQLEDASLDLENAERTYNYAKTEYEIALARTRLDIGSRPVKTTVQERDDEALLACASQARDLASATTLLKAARGNIDRIKTQIDVARSLGTSVRSAMDLA